jgi:chromosome partitioning protein
MEERKPKAVMVNVLKGGLGKSTVTKNTARSLCEDSSVLVMDCDDNGHLTKHLGFSSEFNGGNKLYEYLDEDSNVGLDDLIYPTGFGFDLLHSTKKMEHVEMAFEEQFNPNTVLKREVVDVLLGDRYDYILFDTPANRSLMTRNAALASGNMLIPLAPGEQGKDGLNATVDRIYRQINERFENGMNILAIVPNMIQKRIDHRNSDRQLLEYLNTSEKTKSYIPNFAHLPESVWDDLSQYDTNPKPGIRYDGDLNNPEPVHDINPESDTINYFDELAQIIKRGSVDRENDMRKKIEATHK